MSCKLSLLSSHVDTFSLKSIIHEIWSFSSSQSSDSSSGFLFVFQKDCLSHQIGSYLDFHYSNYYLIFVHNQYHFLRNIRLQIIIKYQCTNCCSSFWFFIFLKFHLSFYFFYISLIKAIYNNFWTSF